MPQHQWCHFWKQLLMPPSNATLTFSPYLTLFSCFFSDFHLLWPAMLWHYATFQIVNNVMLQTEKVPQQRWGKMAFVIVSQFSFTNIFSFLTYFFTFSIFQEHQPCDAMRCDAMRCNKGEQALLQGERGVVVAEGTATRWEVRWHCHSCFFHFLLFLSLSPFQFLFLCHPPMLQLTVFSPFLLIFSLLFELPFSRSINHVMQQGEKVTWQGEKLPQQGNRGDGAE